MDDEKALWKKCAEFHGHECGGLTIGYKAALYAKELLDLDFSEDEQVVCISENDACGVDAIQVILGCSVGKGNLLFHICGKQAFSFYDRGIRKVRAAGIKRKAQRDDKGRVLLPITRPVSPGRVRCEGDLPAAPRKRRSSDPPVRLRGEMTGEKWLREAGGKKLCPDCLARLSGK